MRRWPLLLVVAALLGGCGADEPASPAPGAGTTGPTTTQQDDGYYRG